MQNQYSSNKYSIAWSVHYIDTLTATKCSLTYKYSIRYILSQCDHMMEQKVAQSFPTVATKVVVSSFT